MSDVATRLNAALEGRYTLEQQIGEGGMATVYLARDIKHNRNVALKVLKPELAAVVGAERFLAEIETTANLQHPHILPLFDSGEADSFLFYVMPYVEGETLGDRIDRENQLPVDEALGIATSIASALQHAHEKGVIHRDIKPGNILLQDGQPVVGDFGIALAVGAAGGARLTETGLSVGTPYYMSPEQATGDQSVGPASDTYALACVLYEMLVGEPPYPGKTAQAVLGKIIQGTPVSATAIRKSIPPNVDAAIRKALEKIPADRFMGAAKFAKALADPAFRYGETVGAGAGEPSGRWKGLAAAGWALALLSVGSLGWSLTRPDPVQPLAQFESPFREGQAPLSFGTAAFNLSPDGTKLVYRGPGDRGGVQLWLRRWDDLDAQPIRGTEGGHQPAISPDGQQLAFRQGNEIKVLAFDGGPVLTLASGLWPRWGDDGYIYFLQGNNSPVRVPVTGGTVEPTAEAAEGEAGFWVADVLPGGESALLHVSTSGVFEVRGMNLGTAESVTLAPGLWPRYSPSGHLTYLTEEGTLMAAPFDASALEVTGPSVPMIEGVTQYALSATGDLAYTVGGSAGGLDTELVWVSREGAVTPLGWTFNRGNEGNYYTLRLSPDGTQVAVRAVTDGNADIWVKELPDGAPRRLTFDEANDYVPMWAPDGRTVTYFSSANVWSTAADGTGQPQQVLDGERDFRQGDWSPDGEVLVLRTTAQVAGTSDQADRDLLAYRPNPGGEVTPLLATGEFAENNPAISPDGRWVAYASDETGRYEVWVRPFPDVESGKYRVSADGGLQPRWAHNGRELFYFRGDRQLIVAEYETTTAFRVVSTETLMTLPVDLHYFTTSDPYDVANDDQRFLMGRQYSEGGMSRAYVLVQNFDEELKRRVPN